MAESRYQVMDFLQRHRDQIIEKVKWTGPIVEAAVSQHLIPEELMHEVQRTVSTQEVMRMVFTALESEPPQQRDAFYQILKQMEPALIQELENREAEHRQEEMESDVGLSYGKTKKVEEKMPKLQAETQRRKDTLKRRRLETLRAIEDIEKLWEGTSREMSEMEQMRKRHKDSNGYGGKDED
ncbi:hypothetical protein MATL_G00232760 [Megalops atlanticus]|uniref:CARD domain-containing protein n=1 Tax=Megalops atlanticus TaxID=7932 RepID=A0A9D3PID5_MEGAT|nr:hypothetical protein MATL_G00232760 [Megalops atlanticus]